MLAFFRRFLNTWLARVFFVFLVGSFGLWGVADVVRNAILGGGEDGSSVANVGGQKIDVAELQDSSRRPARPAHPPERRASYPQPRKSAAAWPNRRSSN